MTKSASVNTNKPRHSGMFKPGQSGNPSGRPKSDACIRELARAHTEDAVKTLAEIAKNKRATASARVSAASALLDRAWGKPAQYIESMNLGLSYTEFLDYLAGQEEERTEAIDVEVDSHSNSEMENLLEGI